MKKSSTTIKQQTMPMFYSSLNFRFNLFSIETNINRKKEAHHKLVSCGVIDPMIPRFPSKLLVTSKLFISKRKKKI
jgi:hypothetical protein